MKLSKQVGYTQIDPHLDPSQNFETEILELFFSISIRSEFGILTEIVLNL